jgi:short-subunit dehydrogenase
MRALVVGATAGLGRAICELISSNGDSLILVASDQRDLDALANHLRLNHSVDIETVAVNVINVNDAVEKIRGAVEKFKYIDTIYFPIGASFDNDNGMLSVNKIIEIININLTIVMAVTSNFTESKGG